MIAAKPIKKRTVSGTQCEEYLPAIPLVNELLPAGIKVSHHGVLRWIHIGVDGIRLEVKKVGGRYFARPSAVQKFLLETGQL